MDIPQRTMNAVGKRDESIKRWMNSSTAKAIQKTDDTHFKITFDNGSMLLSAVSSGDIEEVERLLQIGTDVNFASADGLTALHQACIDESIELVEILVNNGANINARDNEGWTPLHAAASTTSLEVVSFLVNHGANISAVNTDGELAVDLADEDDIKNFLMEKLTANNINLTSARNLEHDKMMKDITLWISKGCVDEIRDPQGASALHVAASKSYMDVMELLVDRLNMDVNIKDNDGWTPLHAAVYWKQLDPVSFLIEHNADYQAKTSIGLLPIDLADEDIILKYKALLRKKNLITSYTKKSTSDDSNDSSSQEVFPHSYKPLPNPILKKLDEIDKANSAVSVEKPALPPSHQTANAAKSPILPPPRQHPVVARPPTSSTKDTNSTKISGPARPPSAGSISNERTSNMNEVAASSGIKLPPKPSTQTKSTTTISSSILPPKSNKDTSQLGSNIILPPRSNKPGVAHPPTAKVGGVALPPTSAKSHPHPTEISLSTIPVRTTPYTFKTLEEALEEITKLNKMVESYRNEISLIESQLNSLKISNSSDAPKPDTNMQSIIDENQRLQKENATLIKAMSALQKGKPKS